MDEQKKNFDAAIVSLVIKQDWEGIYNISSYLMREISILIDAEDTIYVDYGGPGEVVLSPPIGSKVPFKLWVHTHPNFQAYWSQTDRNSLMIATGILEVAFVLGRNGILATSVNQDKSITNLTGLDWTKEEVKSWEKILEEGI